VLNQSTRSELKSIIENGEEKKRKEEEEAPCSGKTRE
jgi:hypothetical protein